MSNTGNGNVHNMVTREVHHLSGKIATLNDDQPARECVVECQMSSVNRVVVAA